LNGGASPTYPWPALPLDFLGNELFLFATGAMAYLHADRIPRLSAVRLAIAVAVALGVAWLTKRWLGEVNAVSLVAIGSVSVLAIVNVDVVKRLNFGFFSYSLYLFHYALIVLASYLIGRTGIVGRDIVNPLAWIPIAVAIGLVCLALYWCTERISNGMVARLRTPSPAPRDVHTEVFGV
jgi:peptidoglycan/LPS O-acetylase OafA/YrhL